MNGVNIIDLSAEPSKTFSIQTENVRVEHRETVDAEAFDTWIAAEDVASSN